MSECPRCNGEMRIKDYQEDNVSEDGKMPCPECEGEGIIENENEVLHETREQEYKEGGLRK